MKHLTILLFALSTSAIAKDKPEIRYAGEGRYTCSDHKHGGSYECAKITTNNRALEERDRQRWEREKQRDYEQRQRDLELYKYPKNR